MKAGVLIESGKDFVVENYPVPDKLEDNTSMLGLINSGLCGTDLHIRDGALPMSGSIIIGHEFLGRIIGMGDGIKTDAMGRELAVGDRVAVNIVESCGHCLLCETGGDASCVHLGESITYLKPADMAPHFHGGFAQLNISPTNYLQKTPDGVPSDVLSAFLCAGPTVIRGVKYAGGIKTGETVVVQGSGAVGLFAVLYAKTLGAKYVIMIGSGSNQKRLDLAKELGADMVLDIRKTTLEERRQAVLDVTDGLGADMIIEGAGTPSAITEGLNLLRLRGRYIWAGQYSDRGTAQIPTHLITFNAFQIFGSAQFSSEDREDYFDFLLKVADKYETIAGVITHKFPVDKINEAFDLARSGGGVKIVFSNE